METDYTAAGNFGFAFDNPMFSDRVLSIEILPDPVEAQPDGTLVIKQQNAVPGDGTRSHGEVCTVKCSLPGAEDSVASKNQDSDGDSMIKESLSGEEATWSRDFSTVHRVKTVHINSAILAIKSPYFYKLFSNGMRESGQAAKIRIHASEEAALMELLNYMYKNSLSTTTLSSLLDILIAADKYDVVSCMQYCSQQLSKHPMDCDLAFSYMNFPSSVLQAVALQQLTNSAKQFIGVQFRNIAKCENQLLNLSLTGIEAILSSDDLQVCSEDVIYDLVMKWAEVHYPQLEERRKVLETRLRHLIRFPYMTSLKLKEVTTGAYFSPEVASEIVLEALFFKNETPSGQHQLALDRHVAGENIGNPDQRFVERAYICRPVKAVVIELPRYHCVVHLDLTRKECESLFPAGHSESEAFYLGKHGFYLRAFCVMNPNNVSRCFGLYLGMLGNESDKFKMDFEIAAWSKREEKYKTQYIDRTTLTGGQFLGPWNLFKTSWEAFIADDSPYFINGKLHLRAMVYNLGSNGCQPPVFILR
ncbi:BTB/POZ domain-containing protein POB1-like [Heracleum sosnowskyi]|uniref:BTB/POZ domain-containing protein POB1-like n=1 Tax=Heracleum sosnowskyi TaxID=360622 RepID=A0AAD8MNC1_9APIA|nr:BTB/POZ domain-containing protein POB1-like [Heracleum sosnowskyi]